MNASTAFEAAFARCPLIAILRGVEPDEVGAVGEGLVAAGFTLIEVPLNSPDPFRSIERLVSRLGSSAVVGAGTVLSSGDVARLKDVGGGMVISPNCDVRVIAAARAAGLVSLPGFQTPTEAFIALEAGATALKLFPADVHGPSMLKAIGAVLPGGTRVLPVGGVIASAIAPWVEAGAAGFGLGSALYRPGRPVAEIMSRAAEFVQAIDAANNRR